MDSATNDHIGHVPSRLMAILEDEEVQKSMHWLPDGKAFAIRNQALFSRTALEKHFKGVQFVSFSKSLLQWGFKMAGVKRGGRYISYTFSHDLFRRDQPELCNSIQRMTIKDWKAARPKRRPKVEAPAPSETEQPTSNKQQLKHLANDTHACYVMPQIQPLFVPVIQSVFQPIWPGMQLQPLFMVNQFPTLEPVIQEANQLSVQPKQQSFEQSPDFQRIQRQTAALSPHQTVSMRTARPKSEKVIIDKQIKKASLTKDELTAVIGMAMLDGTS